MPEIDSDSRVQRFPTAFWKVALIILAVIGVIWMLRLAQPLLVPIVLALLISYALDPVVRRFEKLKIPKVLAAGFMLVALVALLCSGAYVLSDDALAIIADLPAAAQKVREAVNSGSVEGGVIDKVQEAAAAIESTASEAANAPPPPSGVTRVQVQDKPIDLGNILFWGPAGILSGVSSIVLLLFLVYFLLISGNLYRRKFVGIAGTLSQRKVTIEILNEIGDQIQRFVIVQAATSLLVATASTLTFYMIGLERPVIWGLATGVLNSIPYFGPLILAAILAVVAFLQFGTIQMAVYVALAASVITTLEGFLLTPWLMGRAVRINGVALFVGLMFWAWVWGIWGLLLAVPMLVIIKSICDRVDVEGQDDKR